MVARGYCSDRVFEDCFDVTITIDVVERTSHTEGNDLDQPLAVHERAGPSIQRGMLPY